MELDFDKAMEKRELVAMVENVVRQSKDSKSKAPRGLDNGSRGTGHQYAEGATRS